MKTKKTLKQLLEEASQAPFAYFRKLSNVRYESDIKLIIVSVYDVNLGRRPVTYHHDKPVGDIIRNWTGANYGFRVKSLKPLVTRIN